MRGRIGLVTGGSRGIGRAIVVELAGSGVHVAFTYRRDEDAAAEVVEAATAVGGSARAYRADIDDLDRMEEIAAEIRRDVGPVDLVVSNAGGASRGLPIAETAVQEFQQLMAVHAIGPVHLIRTLLPDLRKAGRADVVVISSAIATQAPPGAAPYVMAKAAMEVAARTLAREERRHGLRVNIVAPGLVATDMGGRLVRAAEGVEIRDLDASAPYGRVCRPEDVAKVVRFLVSEAGEYVSGQRINVDAGGPDTAIF